MENIERGQRYSCPRCCSSFSKKGNMLTHFRHECGKEPRFQCPYCGKKDRKSSNTYRHIRLYHKGSSIQAYRLYWIRKSALTIKLMCRAENKRNSVNQLSYEQPRSSLFRDLHLTSTDQQMKGICIAESLFSAFSILACFPADIEFLVDIGSRSR